MLCAKCKKEIIEGSTFCPWCGKKQEQEKRKALKRPNGAGCVRKLSGRRRKPWAAITTDSNLHRHLLGTFATRDEGLVALSKYQLAGEPDNWGMTVADAYNQWSATHFSGLTKAGISGYEDSWKRFNALAAMKMRDLKSAHIQSVIDKAVVFDKKSNIERPLSKSGKEKIRQLASQLCKWAMQQDVISKNYAEYAKINAPESKEKEIFSDKEVRIFEEHADDKDVQIILVLIYSGMRINELFKMRIKDVHLPTHMIGGEKTEAGENRVIPIHSKVEHIVREWIEKAGPEQIYLVVNSKGGMLRDDNWRPRNYYPLLKKLCVRRFTPHATRHTFATLMRRTDVKEEIIARIMGHSKFSTTAGTYIHTDIDELCSAIMHI